MTAYEIEKFIEKNFENILNGYIASVENLVQSSTVPEIINMAEELNFIKEWKEDKYRLSYMTIKEKVEEEEEVSEVE